MLIVETKWIHKVYALQKCAGKKKEQRHVEHYIKNKARWQVQAQSY